MKTLRFIGVAIIAIIISTNLISCSDNEEATFISLDENTPLDDTIFTFTEEGGEKTISFKFNDKNGPFFHYTKQQIGYLTPPNKEIQVIIP